MEITVDITLKMAHSEAKALVHLLGALSRDKQKELGLDEDEISINNDLYAVLAPFLNLEDD